MLIARPDLEDSGYPVIVRLLPRWSGLAGVLLALDRRIVGNKDKAFAIILDSVY
jgi:hypothetical protein